MPRNEPHPVLDGLIEEYRAKITAEIHHPLKRLFPDLTPPPVGDALLLGEMEKHVPEGDYEASRWLWRRQDALSCPGDGSVPGRLVVLRIHRDLARNVDVPRLHAERHPSVPPLDGNPYLVGIFAYYGRLPCTPWQLVPESLVITDAGDLDEFARAHPEVSVPCLPDWLEHRLEGRFDGSSGTRPDFWSVEWLKRVCGGGA